MSYCIYKNILCIIAGSYNEDDFISLYSRNLKSKEVGFVQEPVSNDKVPVYKIMVNPGTESDFFGIFLQATYKNLTFYASVNTYGQLSIAAGSSNRSRANVKKDDATYMPLGFKYNPDRFEYRRYVDFNDCSEVYEIRKDYISPKGFIPGETKELNGGYTVTDYNLEKSPFVTSRKIIYKDGIKLTDFVEDLW
jgi:hypothetical protein